MLKCKLELWSLAWQLCHLDATLLPCPPPLGVKKSASSELDMTHICTYSWSAGQQLQTSHSSNWTVLCDYMWPINLHYKHTNSCGWCYTVSVYWAWFENHFAIHHDWPVEFTRSSNKDTIPHNHFINRFPSHRLFFSTLWNPIPPTQMSWASTLFGENKYPLQIMFFCKSEYHQVLTETCSVQIVLILKSLIWASICWLFCK